jgi:hypothetical protein
MRNLDLIRLKENLPCKFAKDELTKKSADMVRLAELFQRWGFKTMLAELESLRSRQEALL